MVKLLLQNHLGKLLKQARKMAQLTQDKLAISSGISMPTVRLLERGRGNLTSWHKVLIPLNLELTGHNLPPGDTIGERISALRHRRELSQRSIAGIVTASPPTIIHLERHNQGRLDVLDKVLTVLGAGAYLTPTGSPTSFYTHAGNSSQSHSWKTPRPLLQKLYSVFGTFDLDPSSPTKSRHTAPVKARVHYTAEDDGLSLPWFGTVFVNPPYGRTLSQWIAKARAEVTQGNTRTVVALIPARTDTTYWHDHIAHHATVFFLRGRLHFNDSLQSAPFPSALIVWGSDPDIVQSLQTALPDSWRSPCEA